MPHSPSGAPGSPDSAAGPAALGQDVLSDSEFEEAVADALDAIPAALAERMDDVVVLVEEEPDPELLGPEDYDEDGLPALLGLYDGVPLTERDDSWSLVLPDRVLVYSGPLRRWCRDRDELLAEIRTTVLHEVGHHFGIEDDRLDELGWA